MKTFKITASTNSYIANRDSMFNGSTEVTLATGLTQQQANKQLLDLFNDNFSDEFFAENWGMAVILSKDKVFGACKTAEDGTRRFDFDSRTFRTEIEDHE